MAKTFMQMADDAMARVHSISAGEALKQPEQDSGRVTMSSTNQGLNTIAAR